MSNFEALKQSPGSMRTNMGKLTAAQMENAMTHMDRMAPSFGRAAVFFRTVEKVEGNQSFPGIDGNSKSSLRHTSQTSAKMLANHKYR